MNGGAGAARDPRLTPSARRSLTLALLVLLLAFVVLTVLVGTGATAGLDTTVNDWVKVHRSPAVVTVARMLAVVGSWYVTGPAAAAIAVALFVLHRRRDAAYLLMTMATSVCLNGLLKVTFRRATPAGAPDGVTAAQFSYPSGHTMNAAAFAAALTFIAWPTRWRTPVLVGAAVYATSMGIARIVLSVHWPTDVAAAWMLGTAAAIAVRLVLTRTLPAEAREERAGDHARRRVAAGPVDVVFLDWGGTLMVDDGTQTGPMATWPQVAAVEGACEALEALRPDHRLIVATNADDSGTRDVLAALYRVDLDTLVDDVVSSRDVGVRKPDPFFYRAALLRAGHSGVPLTAARAVMVGDSWPNDMAGAHEAGLRTIWFNPRRAARPAGSDPPGAEIVRLADLPAAVAALSAGAAPSGDAAVEQPDAEV